MKVKEIFNLCTANTACPQIIETEDGDFLIQGYVLKEEDLKSLNTPEGEDVVRLPKEFFETMIKSLNSC